MNEFDHFVKEKLRVKYYIRYTDDCVILHDEPMAFASLLPAMRDFLQEQLTLELHERKTVLRKLRQGIDFLGYVLLPHYRVLRTSTKRRMWKNLAQWNRNDFDCVESYLGMLGHCSAYDLRKKVREATWYEECWKYGIMRPF